MRTRLAAISFVLGWAVLRMPFGASAQSNPTQINSGNATGLIPYTAYGGVRENINLTNGNLNLQVPLLSLPGRDGHDLQISLIYDSKMWTLHGEYYGVNGKEYWWEYEGHPQVGELGWRLNLPYLYEGVLTYDSGMNSCYVGFIVAVPDGSKHSFSNRAQCTYPAYTVSRTDAEDGSFLTLDTSNESDVSRLHEGWHPHSLPGPERLPQQDR